MSISKDFVNIYKSYLREVNHYKKTIKHVENMKRKIEKKQVMATEEEIKLLEKEELNEEDEFSCTKDKIYYFSNGDKYIGKVERNELHGNGYYIMYDNGNVILEYTGEFVKVGEEWHHNSGLEIDKAFPNAKKEQLTHLLDQLEALKEEFDSKGLTVTARNIVASGTIEITKDDKIKRLNVSGTVDLLLHDKQGNFYIYDIKTHRGKIDGQKRRKWSG